MKKLAIILLLISSTAMAWGQLTLISCEHGFSRSLNKYVYTGTYRHSTGDVYVYMFDSYCPYSVDF